MRLGFRHPGVNRWETGTNDPEAVVQPEKASSARAVWVDMRISSGRHARPNRVEGFQPIEQIGILGSWYCPGEGLVEMVVSVDQAGQHDMTA